MYEVVDSDVNANSDTAHTLLSDTRFYSDPLDAESIGDPRSSHLGCDPLDVRGVARKHQQSEDS